MGRKVSNLTINPKKFGAFGKPCMQEMVKLLNCMALNSNNDDKCFKYKDILTACMDAQAGKKRKPWGSVNYQFRKLDKQSKYNMIGRVNRPNSVSEALREKTRNNCPFVI